MSDRVFVIELQDFLEGQPGFLDLSPLIGGASEKVIGVQKTVAFLQGF